MKHDELGAACVWRQTLNASGRKHERISNSESRADTTFLQAATECRLGK
jgi:hypothetical protein